MDVVKIDKSFVDRIAMDAEGTAMVRGVIALGNGLGLTTVAEGVERDVLHEARRLCPLRAI
jgi:EAL domain-containing protein (putative c-di-GMP-specific phosphodiesterase class I)